MPDAPRPENPSRHVRVEDHVWDAAKDKAGDRYRPELRVTFVIPPGRVPLSLVVRAALEAFIRG